MSLGVALRFIHSNLLVDSPRVAPTTKQVTQLPVTFLSSITTDEQKEDGISEWLYHNRIKIGYTNDAKQKDYIPSNLGLGQHTTVFDETNKLTFHPTFIVSWCPHVPRDQKPIPQMLPTIKR
jgi:hypothetical protein